MKNIVIIIIALLLIGAFSPCKAQNDNTSKNVIYIEALGNGFNYEHENIWGTLNYERNIIYSQGVNCSIRMGFGFNNRSSSHNPYAPYIKSHFLFSLPLMFNFISNPDGNHHLETGLGIIITNDAFVDIKKYEVGYTGNLEYRYQKKTKGIYFSAGWTPSIYFDPYFNEGPQLVHFYDIIFHLAMLGISIGYHF